MFAADAGDLAFETANARFPRVMPHDVVERFILKLDLIGLQSAVLAAARHKIIARDLHFFFFGISGQLDDLHSVA